MPKDKPTLSQTPRFASFVPKPWVQDLYPDDDKQPPLGLLNESSDNLATTDIPTERYWSQEWHRMEVEHVWKKTWQVACRIEEIPNAGDYLVYDIVDDSVIVVRSSTGDIKAFTNSCCTAVLQSLMVPVRSKSSVALTMAGLTTWTANWHHFLQLGIFPTSTFRN